MYRTPMTVQQMEEESRKATAEGMRQIAEALAKKQAEPKVSDESSDDDSDDSDSSDDRKGGRRSRRRREPKTKTPAADKLEDRIRYLQLDLANAKVDVDDARVEAVMLKARLEPYTRANNELGFMRSALERSKKGLEELTTKQLANKISLFKEESSEHIVLCTAAVNKIDLHEIKAGLERVIVAERRKIVNQLETLESILWWREMKLRALIYGGAFTVVLLIALVLFYLF
jgi:hypothetical protein